MSQSAAWSKTWSQTALYSAAKAANHVNPIHGGGIKEAVIIGQMAADVIGECLKKRRRLQEGTKQISMMTGGNKEATT